MACPPIDEKIQQALESLARKPATAHGTYIRSFQTSARGKAEAVLSSLKTTGTPFDNMRPIFLSIGGGDGEELHALLEQSEATLGILVEKTKEFADMARERQARLPPGKTIQVYEGDAQRRVPEAIQFARSQINAHHGDFLAASCHAVIHELYDRGEEEFDLAGFLGSIFRYQDLPIWFTSREPGVPAKWPEVVLLGADCRSESLLELANAIIVRHPELEVLKPKAHIFGDYLRLHKTLAMEVMVKLFYIDDLSYEITERSTAVDHAKFQSMLMLAVGETAVKEQRAIVTTVSEPTVSFKQKWQEFRIEAKGMNNDGQISPLSVAESQTRIVAWRVPTELKQPQSPPAVISPVSPKDIEAIRPDILTAANALQSQDTSVLEALCVSRGRRWIESQDRARAIPLLEKVKNSYPTSSLLGSWVHYLLSLAALFSDKAQLEMFSEEIEANASPSGLAKLFRAERMEFLRKIAKDKRSPQITEIANSLLPALPQNVLSSSTDLERYVIATTKFVLANLLRSGGLYVDAWREISEAENIYRPNIESHATELAHCHYAKTVCVALTGLANFDLHVGAENGLNREFAFALIELAYAHAAWFVGDVTQAAKHADSAATVFDEIESPHYAKRARTLEWLLRTWKYEGPPTPPTGSNEFAECVQTLRGATDNLPSVAKWLSTQRPSNVLGLIQFAKDKPTWIAPIDIAVPATLHWDDNRKLAWRSPEKLASLSELDALLRKYLQIPVSRRIPLITD